MSINYFLGTTVNLVLSKNVHPNLKINVQLIKFWSKTFLIRDFLYINHMEGRKIFFCKKIEWVVFNRFCSRSL